MHSQPDNIDDGRIAGVLAQEPTAILLLRIVLNMTPVLMNQQILAKATDGSIQFEFLASVMTVCGRRKYLDNQQRIQDVVLLVTGQLQFAANHAAIGISIKSRARNVNP